MAVLIRLLKHDKINPVRFTKTKKTLAGRNAGTKVIGPKAK